MTLQPQGRATFRARLQAKLVLLSLAVLAAGGGIVYGAARQTLMTNLDGALWSIARAEVASSIDGPEGAIHIHEENQLQLDPAGVAFYEKYVRIEDTAGRLVVQTRNLDAGSPLRGDERRRQQALRGRPSIANIAHGPENLRAIYYPVKDVRGNLLVAVVAIPRAPVDHSLRSLAGILILALFLAGAMAALVARRLARRLTLPLEQIATAAVAVGDSSLRERIPVVSTDAELQDVTAGLNEMLARLERAFAQQEQLIRSQQRFIADASHELRSPLSNLRGTVEVALRRRRGADDYRETLETALPEIERLSRLVSDLLTLSRADAGRLSPYLELCDLRQVAATSVNAHLGRAADRSIHLDLHDAGSAPVWGDYDRLRQVLDNLLDNALRHAPAESTVSVTVRGREKRGEISVRDSGPGIPESDLPHLFDRFYRTDGSRNRQSGGMGLGLAIARAILDAHQGSMDVKSTLGVGTTFTFSLPLASEAASGEADTTHPFLVSLERSG